MLTQVRFNTLEFNTLLLPVLYVTLALKVIPKPLRIAYVYSFIMTFLLLLDSIPLYLFMSRNYGLLMCAELSRSLRRFA